MNHIESVAPNKFFIVACFLCRGNVSTEPMPYSVLLKKNWHQAISWGNPSLFTFQILYFQDHFLDVRYKAKSKFIWKTCEYLVWDPKILEFFLIICETLPLGVAWQLKLFWIWSSHRFGYEELCNVGHNASSPVRLNWHLRGTYRPYLHCLRVNQARNHMKQAARQVVFLPILYWFLLGLLFDPGDGG